MNLDRPSAGHSPGADETPAESPEPAAPVVRERGAALVEALEQHLPGTREHAEATASYAFAVAAKLGLGRERAEAVREAAKLHDVGLVYIVGETLRKPLAELTEDERGALALHPETGAQLARGAGVPPEVCGWLRRWSERFDGSGPGGLSATRIPIESRIIHAACRCDGVLSAPDAAAGDRAGAIERLRSLAGSVLDPQAVEALAGILRPPATG